MKKIKNISLKPSILITIFLALAVLVFSSAYYELKQSKKEMLHLMAEQAHSLLQSIIVSSQEVLFASDEVETENARDVGHIHVAHEIWKRLGLNKILYDLGLRSNAIKVTEVMVLNRLINPSSELGMVDWIKNSAIAKRTKLGLFVWRINLKYDAKTNGKIT